MQKILFFLIIAVISISCSKEVITLDPRALDFIDFYPRSYWIYDVYNLDSVFLRTDSIHVSGRNIVTEYEGSYSDRIYYERLGLVIRLNNEICGGCCYDSYHNYSNVGKWDLPFNRLNDEDQVVVSSDSLFQNGKLYTDIISVYGDVDKESYTVRFVRGAGVVYFYSEFEKEYWILVRSELKKY